MGGGRRGAGWGWGGGLESHAGCQGLARALFRLADSCCFKRLRFFFLNMCIVCVCVLCMYVYSVWITLCVCL